MPFIQQLLIAAGLSLLEMLIQYLPTLLECLAKGLASLREKMATLFNKPVNSVPAAA